MQEADCHTIISRKLNTADFKVLNFQESPFEQVNGYLGEHSSLKVTIERLGNEENHYFFLKTLPEVPSQRNFILQINGFFKEKQFFNRYCSLLSQHSINILDDAIPKCFLTKEDDFVFEDLTKEEYKTFSSRISLEMDCVRAALTTLAKLHSSCLILEETKSCKLIEEFEEELAETFYSDRDLVQKAFGSSKTGVRALIDLTHDEEMYISKETFKEKAVESLDQQKLFARPSTKFRNTICHGDAWTKNFMFRFDDHQVKCVVVDFQTYRYSPPGQDVMAFIYLTTDRALQHYFQELLSFYYQELDGNLGKFGHGGLIPEEEFFESCRYYKQFALVQRITHFQVVIMSEEMADEVMADPENNHSVMFEDKYDFMVMACRKDAVFRRMNFEAIEDFRLFLEDNLK